MSKKESHKTSYKDFENIINGSKLTKKKISIITVSSILAAGILSSAIALPVVLIGVNKQKLIELNKVTAIYDLTTSNVKLVVIGKNLLNERVLYNVLTTTTNDFIPIVSNVISLTFINDTEIHLDFTDHGLAINSIYKIRLNNSNYIDSEIITSVNENIKRPNFTITTQPKNTEVLSSSSNSNISLTVAISPIVNEISGIMPTYQWMISDTNTTTDDNKWIPIEGATSTTYIHNITNFDLGVKKYFKCVISYKYAAKVTSDIVYIQKVRAPVTILITNQPSNKSLTSSSSNPTLSIEAVAQNSIAGEGELSYQWYKTSFDPVKQTNNSLVNWELIPNATSSNYLVDIETNGRNNWQDAWYKCDVGYLNATPIFSNPAYVKMVLTESEAMITLFNWLRNDDNIRPFFTRFLNTSTNVSDGSSNKHLRHRLYSSIHNHVFTTIPASVEVVSIMPETIAVPGAYSYKSYKVVLKTKADAAYKTKVSGESGTPIVIPAGSFIEFSLFFSFSGDNQLVRQQTNTPNTTMSLKVKLARKPNITTVFWEWNNVPTDANPLKKGAYPMRVFSIDSATNVETNIFTDSIYIINRFTFDSSQRDIPTYNIKVLI